MTTKTSLLFCLFASIFTLSTLVEPYPLSWLVKLLPVAILIFVSAQRIQSRADSFFLFGLIFSACGDFLLDYDRVNWFIFGLGAFLIAHLFYIASFRPVGKKRIPAVVAYLLYGAGMFSIIYPGLGQLFVPVFVYMLVLLVMGCMTLVSQKSNAWLMSGGVFFVISDSIIGVDKFYSTIPYSHLIIMATYYLAQFALFKGIIGENRQAA